MEKYFISQSYSSHPDRIMYPRKASSTHAIERPSSGSILSPVLVSVSKRRPEGQ